MKKFVLVGAVFGLIIVPLSAFGLGSIVAMVLFMPFVIVPRTILSALAENIGVIGLSVGLLMAISAAWYALIGALLGLLFKRAGKKIVIAFIVLYYLAFAFFGVATTRTIQPAFPQDDFSGLITSFEECARAGNPVMESYPRQCRSEYGLFIEDVGDRIEQEVDCDGPEDVCLKKIECQDGFVTEDIEVCGRVNVVCITAPCNPVEETFENRCVARERGAFDIRVGSCEYWQEVDTLVQTQGPITYAVDYPKTWFPHESGENIIFTKNAELDQPVATEGFALGSYFMVIAHDFSDSDVESYEDWLDLYGMTTASEFFVSSSDENINGYQMRRVVTQAAGAGGEVLHYVFFAHIQNILVFSQYPYGPDTEDTIDFERVIRTFRIEDGEMEVVRSSELIEMECQTSADCPVPMDYAVQSNCPYSGVCVQGTCGVICPLWEHSPDLNRSVSYSVQCATDSECDCSEWDRGGKYGCGCFDGRCASLVLHKK